MCAACASENETSIGIQTHAHACRCSSSVGRGKSMQAPLCHRSVPAQPTVGKVFLQLFTAHSYNNELFIINIWSTCLSHRVPVTKLAVRLQPASPLSPPFSPPPQHLASLQLTIILALSISNSKHEDRRRWIQPSAPLSIGFFFGCNDNDQRCVALPLAQ